MSDREPSARDVDPRAGGNDDPLSADRRVLVIGAVAMVVLVLVGVVSARLFTASACRDIASDPRLPRAAGTQTADVLDDGLPVTDEGEQRSVPATLTQLEAELGPVVGLADVTGADRLVAVDGGAAALGEVNTVLGSSAQQVRATAAVGTGTVVGDGDTLFTLALTNPLTGQVDAFAPTGLDLEQADCIDTATVGTPFAFFLDAGEGELALFRVEDDGEAPELQLRDADGERWSSTLDAPEAAPGLAAERLRAALGEQLVVTARRVGSAETEPPLQAFERRDGALRWSAALEALTEGLDVGEGAVRADVLTVTPDHVVVAVAPEDEPSAASVVGLDAADGSRRWVLEEGVDGTPVAAAATADGAVLVVAEDGLLRILRFDPTTGTAIGSAATEVSAAADEPAGIGIARHGQRTLVAMGDALAVLDGDHFTVVDTEVAVVDVVATEDSLVLLLSDGEGAVAVAFAG